MSNRALLRGDEVDIVYKIMRLKRCSNISIISFYIPSDQRMSEEQTKKVIDSFADLTVNRNIKRLIVNTWGSFRDYGAYLFFLAMANGQIGENIEHLCFDGYKEFSMHEAGSLEKYLKRNRKLKHLELVLQLGNSPASLKAIAAISKSSIVSLHLTIYLPREIREIGLSLGQCESIERLTVSFIIRHENEHQVADALRCLSGIAEMPRLSHLSIHRSSIPFHAWEKEVFHTILESIQLSESITTVYVTGAKSSAFAKKADSFCTLNKVFGTKLVGFGPTVLWTRVLSKIQDDSAKATFLYRLLQEKPELIVNCGQVQQIRRGGFLESITMWYQSLVTLVRTE